MNGRIEKVKADRLQLKISQNCKIGGCHGTFVNIIKVINCVIRQYCCCRLEERLLFAPPSEFVPRICKELSYSLATAFTFQRRLERRMIPLFCALIINKDK